MSFVLDASLTLSWCFRDESTEYTNAVLGELARSRAIVPSIWFYEVNNGIVTALRAGRTSESRAKEFIDLLVDLPIDVQATPEHRSSVAVCMREIAAREKISAYDASYVALALDLGIPIATLDGVGKRAGMKQAAERSGVALFRLPRPEAEV